MDEQQWLAERFEEHRARLRAVAFRMLGGQSEADDAVQEAWLRLSRSDASEVENLGGWLTTVVARVCLNMLRARRSRREESLEAGALGIEPFEAAMGGNGTPDRVGAEPGVDPEQAALVADSVGLALMVVLDSLAPAERVAFVLHDMFGLPFEEIAPIVGRTPAATRQLASRSRRRLQGSRAVPASDLRNQRPIVEAFLAASREGRFESLVAMLDPDVVLRADAAGARMGAPAEVRGAREVAETFSGRARVAKPALLGGTIGAAWVAGGVPRVVFSFTVEHGKIVAIDLLADPEHLQRLQVAVLEDRDAGESSPAALN
jgi:RNA polymerase sigma-70 factor (ECF subfamily)